MKKALALGLFLFSLTLVKGQDLQNTANIAKIDRNNLQIRPNSRDYSMVRKGNEHQRMVRLRMHDMLLRKQALMNRKQAMERRRENMQQRMFRQQQNRQRLVHQRRIHR